MVDLPENTPDMAVIKLRDMPFFQDKGFPDTPIFEELRVIAYKPELANYLGSMEAAVYYQQLSHWQKYATQPDGYFYKSASEMYEETYITEKQQRRCREQLKAIGWIDTKKKMANGHPTYHFKVMVRTFGLLIPNGKMPNGIGKKASSITKNTTQDKRYTSEMLEKIDRVYDVWLKLMVVDIDIRRHGTTDERRAALLKAQKRTRLTDKRKIKIAARVESMGLDRVIEAIKQISKSQFHRDGILDDGTPGSFKADLEWLCLNDERIEKWANMGDSK